MIYRARKAFLGNGVQYQPGDIVPNLDGYPRPESLIRAGFVVLVEEPKKTPAKRAPAKRAPVKELKDASL
jgi:hypothetical protein